MARPIPWVPEVGAGADAHARGDACGGRDSALHAEELGGEVKWT